MKKKQTVSGLLIGTSLIASLAATTAAADVTLRYAIWDASQAPVFENIIEAFEAANPEISVQLEVTPWNRYWTKLQTEAGNGNMPDVFWMNPFNFPLYASEGVVLPIDDMIADSGFDIDAVPQIMRDVYSYEGNIYSIPNNRDAIVVWYNTEIFDNAGVDYPSDDWTWDDFQRMAGELTDADNDIYGTAAFLNFRQVWINTIHQAGGSILSEDQQTAQWDSPEAAEGLRYWAEMAQAGHSPSVDQLANTDQNSLFLSGRVAMLYAGSWMGITYHGSELAENGHLAVTELPRGPQNGDASTSSLGNMIGAGGENIEEAYQFVEFLGGEEAGAIYTAGGVALSAYPQHDQNFVDYFSDRFDASSIPAQIDNVFGLPRSFNSPVWLGLMNGVVGPIFRGEQDLEEGLVRLNREMQAALDAESR